MTDDIGRNRRRQPRLPFLAAGNAQAQRGGPQAEILPLCQQLGIGLVPYSPLGRGFLTGAIRDTGQLAADDWRRNNPRFQAENLAHNLALVDAVTALAAARGCTPAAAVRRRRARP